MNKPLYEKDFFAWTQAQADALRRRSANELDWENLQEEVESMGKQQRGELHSHFVILLQHLLKWRYQEGRRTRSWRLSIEEQRSEIARLTRLNPSLHPVFQAIFDEAYPVARLRALRETRLANDAIPLDNPFTTDEALAQDLDAPTS